MLSFLFCANEKALAGHTDWRPEQPEGQIHGPYVRMHVPDVIDHLANLLNNSVNVISWNEKPFFHACDKNKMEPAKQLPEDMIC
jgi:hypothetical protein